MNLKGTCLPKMEMSDDELFEDDVAEVLEFSENEIDQSDSEDGQADDTPARDDSSLIFSKHEGSVFCIDLQPESESLVVTGAQDEMAYVWDINSGEVLLTCTGHKDSVTSVGFNHDGTYVATGDLSGCLQVWKLSTKNQIWKTENGDTTWLKWHPGANVLLAAANTGEVYIWKIPRGDCKVLPGHNTRSEIGQILPDGKRLAVGYDDGSLNLFDMQSSNLLRHVPPCGSLPQGVISMDSYFDNSLLLYGTEGTQAHMLKTQTGKIVSTFSCADTPSWSNDGDGVEALGFCKDHNTSWAATGTLSGKLTIWDISREERRQELNQDTGITKLLWLKSDVLITGSMDGVVRLYDGRSGKVEREFHGHSTNIFDLVMSLKNHRILSTSDDNTVRVFNSEPPEGE